MQQAMRIETVVSDALVRDLPQLQPLLGHRIQVIALDLGRDEADAGSISFEQFLATRPQWPEDRPAITLEEMEAGIVQGALNHAHL